MRSRAIVLAVAMLAICSLTAPGRAAAATILSAYGPVGVWRIDDHSTNPSFRCIYKNADASNGQLSKIRVWPAKVFGTSPTQQRIGWKFTVVGQADHDGTWIDLYTSPWQYGTATTARRAQFSPMAWVPNKAIVNGNNEWDFNVHMEIKWFPKSTSAGWVVLQLDYYRFLTRWDNEVFHAPCGSTGYEF